MMKPIEINSDAVSVKQLYTNCLAEATYFLHSNGEAAVIDPLRDVDEYLKMAAETQSQIKYIFETHFHADFVSGHVELARRTGAKIIYGPGAETGFDAHIGQDGEKFVLGEVTLELLHTPGHTPESSTYLLKNAQGAPMAIFTGDTLFLGDVGRPDLTVRSDLSMEQLAGMLFDSLRNKIMQLPDEVVVYPGHGAGSSCGKNMSKETVDTLGAQKATNYALRADMTKEEFIKEVTTGIAPPPQYFPKNALLNKSGYANLAEVEDKSLKALSVAEFKSYALKPNTLILDVRSAAEFAQGHIENSVFIGLDGQFAMWVGALIEDLAQPILLIAPKGREKEAVTRMARVGYEGVIGYLEGGLENWIKNKEALASIRSISATQFSEEMAEGIILDVRKEGEFAKQHIPQAQHHALDFIQDWKSKLDKAQPYFVHCAGGYRSMIATSILKREGYSHLTDIQGGFKAISETSIPLTDAVCPSTL
ncbi:MBL fold metallo-hydrolase [Persicobacter diffluens]|uniref:MBL fold metallo-hydrolase n=1 Tax=Persicobacter diffluens TaxID=981 RepID=A0AAN5APD4_9BACT|nr:MBL fold metallo-hydrolase [Persicobacter diffluens]